MRWRLGIFLTAIVVTHAAGQTSQPASASQFARVLNSARPGDVVLTSFAKLEPTLPMLPVVLKPSADGACLVFSDRPEYFRAGDGIASQDNVKPGRVRFYTYHVPVLTDGKPRRILTLFENLSEAEATLKFTVHCEPKPSGDYNAMAKQAMSDLLLGQLKTEVIKIPPHGHYVSDGTAPISKNDLLVHGLFEFTTDQPLRLTVAQVTATNDLDADIAHVQTLPKLPMLPYGLSKDKANRGLFLEADFDGALTKTYDTADGPAEVIVADGKTDPWQPGVDGISGDQTIDKGNYGIVYRLHLKWKSTDGRGVAVLLTGLRYDQTECGLLAAAVSVNDGRASGGVIRLPRDAVRFHGIPEACVIQTFDPPPLNDKSTIELTYTPPGACCLPTPILLVPMDK